MSAYEFIRYEQTNAVVTITLNRPNVMNALSPGLEDELHESLDVADADDSVRAIIFTGEGRAFSAGYDLGADPSEAGSTAETLKRWWDRSLNNPDKMMHMMELSKPVIAAVNGWCMGGGLWYALAADITIASEHAVFAQPEIRMVSNSSYLFTLIAGWKHAHRYTLTGDHFDAAEAERIGIVNEVVPHDELMTRSVALAERLALVPPDSIRINKRISTYGLEAQGLRNALNVNAALSVIVHASGDSPDVANLSKAFQEEGLKAMLVERDGPFLPEPGGPRSKVKGTTT